MASGPNVKNSGRGFSVVTDPDRFTNYPRRRYVCNSLVEKLVFDNQSNSSGSTVYSDGFSIKPAEGFTVYSKGTGGVVIETSIDPTTAGWVNLDTLSGDDFYSSSAPISFIRIGLSAGASNMTVNLFRKYAAY